jgi:hypothetical protein
MKNRMKQLSLILVVVLLTSSCAFTFVGIITLEDYKIKKNAALVEKALVEVQLKYPKLRTGKESLEALSKIYNYPANNYYLNTEEKAYFQKYSDYYFVNRHGRKEFYLHHYNGKYSFNLQVLDPEKSSCLLGIIHLSMKENDTYIGYSDLNDEQIKKALKVFDQEIWPKIKECIAKVE